MRYTIIGASEAGSEGNRLSFSLAERGFPRVSVTTRKEPGGGGADGIQSGWGPRKWAPGEGWRKNPRSLHAPLVSVSTLLPRGRSA